MLHGENVDAGSEINGDKEGSISDRGQHKMANVIERQDKADETGIVM